MRGMGDALALLAGGFVCMVLFVAETVRADRRSHEQGGHITGMTWRGWLLAAAGCLSVGTGTMLWWTGLFSR